MRKFIFVTLALISFSCSNYTHTALKVLYGEDVGPTGSSMPIDPVKIGYGTTDDSLNWIITLNQDSLFVLDMWRDGRDTGTIAFETHPEVISYLIETISR